MIMNISEAILLSAFWIFLFTIISMSLGAEEPVTTTEDKESLCIKWGGVPVVHYEEVNCVFETDSWG